MKILGKVERSYKQTYKKKTSTADAYLPKGASKKITVCEGCHAVYKKKRWYAEPHHYSAAVTIRDTAVAVCPACLKIRDNFPGGIVTLKGDYVLPHKQELLNLIKNEEARARGVNPLERVMSVKETGYGGIVVSTTNEKLAQRIGRSIKKAFRGNVTYQWSHDNKLARVDWQRAA
jgi:NMD protein affecting ribosome stability and mRNA decay